MLSCEGKAVTVADLVAAYRKVCGPVQRGRTRFPGIVEHARALGVSRIHLYFVLTGVRRSPRIEAYFKTRRAS